mgnify:FL=1
MPSLYNLLKRLKAEGYTVKNLPATEKEFEKLLMTQGAVLSTYAEGAFDDFLKNGRPALVGKSEYESWVQDALPEELYADVVQLYGEAPGRYMSTVREGEPCLAVARIDLGNVVLLPQPMAAVGDDAFAIVHGAKTAPPHPYIGAYLWAQYGFGADAMIHFGTHGSLEFTPRKQVALCRYDWPDRLVGTLPHFYYYTIGNVGESMMAKRRSYATTISYLTPPFTESKTRGQYKELMNKIEAYYKTDEARQPEASIAVKKIAVKMGLHRDLRLDSLLTQPYTAEEIARILDLPKGVIPVTTIVVGHPDESPELTDRLPLDAVVHCEKYHHYTSSEIDELWAEKETSEETRRLLEENGLPNLAQIFTRNRYRAEDNLAISRNYFALLKKQGFFNN